MIMMTMVYLWMSVCTLGMMTTAMADSPCQEATDLQREQYRGIVDFATLCYPWHNDPSLGTSCKLGFVTLPHTTQKKCMGVQPPSYTYAWSIRVLPATSASFHWRIPMQQCLVRHGVCNRLFDRSELLKLAIPQSDDRWERQRQPERCWEQFVSQDMGIGVQIILSPVYSRELCDWLRGWWYQEVMRCADELLEHEVRRENDSSVQSLEIMLL